MNRPRILCRDGFTLSVQASRGHYCSPKVTDSPYYISVEIGYPSTLLPKDFDEYCKRRDKPLDTVYGYVPIRMVIELIDSHDGSDNNWLESKI